MKRSQGGFTIVELLIVIVVIAILAAITTVAFNGVQDRARSAKISADLNTLTRAIMAARVNTNQTFAQVTGSTGTAGGCVYKSDGTDLSTLSMSDSCWTSYQNALLTISDASGVNVKNLVDPWGRPYAIDENEGEGGSPCSVRDRIGTYPQPFQMGWTFTNEKSIAFYNC